MFMKAVYYFIFINLVLLSSCGSQRSKGDIQKLVPNIFLSDDALNCPYYMCVTDKYFILGNVKGDTILDVFSLGGKRLNLQVKIHTYIISMQTDKSQNIRSVISHNQIVCIWRNSTARLI